MIIRSFANIWALVPVIVACFMAGAEVQSSTCSPLLGELDCLTGAWEAQGSIIDLTSQSCRAPSPSFTPTDCHPHTNSTTRTHTHTRWLECVSTQRCLMWAVRLSVSVFYFTRNYTPTVLVSLPPCRRYFSSLEKLNGAKLTARPHVSPGCLEVMKWQWAVGRMGRLGEEKWKMWDLGRVRE